MANWQQVQDEEGNVYWYDHDTGNYFDEADLRTDNANQVLDQTLAHVAEQRGLDAQDFARRIGEAGAIMELAADAAYAVEIEEAQHAEAHAAHRPASHGRDTSMASAMKDLMGDVKLARAEDAGTDHLSER